MLEQPTYNWTQDEQMIFSAINKVAGRETRELEYMIVYLYGLRKVGVCREVRGHYMRELPEHVKVLVRGLPD